VKPYYQDDLVTIYNADWRAVAPVPSSVDLVLADPPYGVSLDTANAARGRGAATNANDYAPIHGDDKPFDPAPFLAYPAAILWGANYYADKLPPRGSWLIWNKIAGLTSKREHGFNDGADCELAWMDGTTGTVPRLFEHTWAGMLKASEKDQRRVHPSQKPVALMGWCLSHFPKAQVVFDPFMGSGPVPRACKDRGMRCIAAELSERYCEIAAERMSQNVLDLGGAA
jgi:site-specific DNA-methyltransferase (adenine-specific)